MLSLHDALPIAEARAVKVGGLTISEVCDFSIGKAVGWFKAREGSLRPKDLEIAQRILKEINERLGFLDNVGLEYLTLSRGSGSLSGGESQRIDRKSTRLNSSH